MAEPSRSPVGRPRAGQDGPFPRHLLRICFLISLEGSSQFCNEETAGQAGFPSTEGASHRGTPPMLTFWLSESQKVRPK